MAADAPRTVDLATFGVPRLYFALLRRRFTGTVTLPQPEPPGDRAVVFRGGMPVWTTWVSDADVLGPMLVEEGRLSPSDLGEALGVMAASGRPLGAVLVERGLLPADELYQALRRQLRRKLLRTFSVAQGRAVVETRVELPPDGDALRPLNVLELLRAGIVDRAPAPVVGSLLAALSGRAWTFHAAFARYRAHFAWTDRDAPVLEAVAAGARPDEVEARFGDRGLRVLAVLAASGMCVEVGSKEALRATGDGGGPSPGTTAPERTKARPEESAATRPTPAARKAAPPSPTPPASHRAARRSPVGSGAAPSSETQPPPAGDFEAQLAHYEAMIERGAHAFELLGVPLDAKRKDVRARWAELSRTFHPDGLAAKGLSHLRQRVENVFAALSEANLLLSDKEKRKELAAAIEAGVATPGGPDPTAMARAAVEAELLAKEGDRYLAAGRFTEAAEKYAAALERTPDEPDLAAAAAYAGYRAGPAEAARRTEALARLEAISAEHPKVRRPPYFAGLLHLEAGAEDLALAAFERALAADPDFVDAQRQVRAIRLRRKAKAEAARDSGEGGGLFGRFRRRK